jgi:hypothetical protein
MQKAKLIGGDRAMGICSSHWKFILTMSLIGAIAAGCLASLVSMQFSATILIQIGQIGDGVPIVDPNAVAEQINFPSFSEKVISSIGLSASDSRAKFIRETLHANVLKGSNLVQVKVDGISRREAENAVAATTTLIQEKHTALFAPERARKMKLLEDYQRSVQSVAQLREFTLAQLNNAISRKTDADSHNITLSSIAEADTLELRALDDHIHRLRSELDPANMFNTKAVGPPDASNSINTMRLVASIVLGLLLGGVLGMFALSMKDARFRTAFNALLFNDQRGAVSWSDNPK